MFLNLECRRRQVMNRKILCVGISLIFSLSNPSLRASPSFLHERPYPDMFDQLHMRFTENRGQIIDSEGKARPDILYTAKAHSARLYYTKTGMSTVYMQDERKENPVNEATGESEQIDLFAETDSPVRIHTVTMTMVGCNPNVVVSHKYELPGYDNFYLAHCPDGIIGVKSCRQIRYTDIYDRVNLVYHAVNPNEFKYEFVCSSSLR